MRARYDAYLRSQDMPNVSIDFFGRMQKDKENRDNNKTKREQESLQ